MEKLPPPESQISVSGHYETVNGITTFVREKVSKTIYQIRIRLKPLRVETHNETCPNMRGVNPFENQECLNKTGCTGICKRYYLLQGHINPDFIKGYFPNGNKRIPLPKSLAKATGQENK